MSVTKKNEIVETFQDEDQRLIAYGIKTITRAIAVILIVFFSSIASCGIITDLTSPLRGDYEREKLFGQAEIEKAKAVTVKAGIELQEAQNKAIKDLIDSGVRPLEARCAVMGWISSTNEDEICRSFAPPMVDNTETSVIIIETEPDVKSSAEELSIKDGNQE